jgi:hypothetical protein
MADGPAALAASAAAPGAAVTDNSLQVVVTARRPEAAMSFREMLSDLNPLQYIPVVGAIYRRMTGDTVPEGVRALGSMVAGGLMGGPVGVAMDVGLLALEKITGIDPEAIEQDVLKSLGIGPDDHAAAANAPVATASATAGLTPSAPSLSVSAPPAPTLVGADAGSASLPSPPPDPHDPASVQPWSQAQLAAYGVTKSPNGALLKGALVGADVLNDLELARIGVAFAGTSAATGPAPAAG